MKLLITAQAVDLDDPVLGFLHGWILVLAARAESIEVICLKEGRHTLPENVRVHSLGKERGATSRLVYVARFLALVWRMRHTHDSVFVHMNEEYILLAGWLWKLLGKRIYFWRNHAKGSLLTDIAVGFSTKVFCTSDQSYTAKFKKTSIMPVGIDTDHFPFLDAGTREAPNTFCCVGRISPVKKVEVMVSAVEQALAAGVSLSFVHYGDALPRDAQYEREIRAKAKNLEAFTLTPAVAQREVPGIYHASAFCVNATPAGSLDKAVLEGMACGCLPITCNPAFNEAIPQQLRFAGDAKSLSGALAYAVAMPFEERVRVAQAQRSYVVTQHSLKILAEKLFGALV